MSACAYTAAPRRPASAFRITITGIRETTNALVLSRAVQTVLRNGLAVLGISAPERMERADAAEAGTEDGAA